jgi:hypothetical protein
MKHIQEKSVSKAQQRLMGQAWALRQGEIKASDIDPRYVDEISKIAFGDMTDKELLKFAETKIEDLPSHISNEEETMVKPGWVVDRVDYIERMLKQMWERGKNNYDGNFNKLAKEMVFDLFGNESEMKETKQIPSNYIGEVPGGEAQLKVVPYFNWNAGQGKEWWTATGQKSPKKLRFIKEFDTFSADDKALEEDTDFVGNKMDSLIDILKEILSPEKFTQAFETILGMVQNGVSKSYGEIFSKIASMLDSNELSYIPANLKP